MSEKYKEIFRLKGMLEKAGVPFKWIVRTDADGYQICYPVEGSGCVCSVIEHRFSYGNEFDMLEIQGLMTETERASHDDTVLGNLTAEDVFSRINDHLHKYKAAYNAGKKVEWRCKNNTHWNTVDDNWGWDDWDLIEDCEISYRIADEEAKHKTERLTKRQLSQWLAQGNGEIMCDGGDTMSVAFIYSLGEENEEVTGQFLVRKWEDTEWHEPTVDYCFPETGE